MNKERKAKEYSYSLQYSLNKKYTKFSFWSIFIQ